MAVFVFVWTFDGVMKAIGVGVVVLVFVCVLALVAWVRLLEWWDRRRKKGGGR